MNDYKIRKQNEKDFLLQYANKNDYTDKMAIVTAIKSKEIIRRDVRLTNLTDDIFKFGINSLEYSYLRFNNNYTIKNESYLTGYKNSKKIYEKTIYFNSGMSAITALLESVFECGGTKIIYSKDIYFETYKILQTKNKKMARKKIMYFDSIDPNFKLEYVKNISKFSNIIGCIIDTTCLTNNNMKEIIDKILDKNQFVFLVKSLTKLDMLGTEYSRMGVLTMLLPKNINKYLATIYTKLFIGIKQKSINYNCCPSPFDFPPFWDSKDFFKLNNARISQITKNVNLMYQSIKNTNYANFKIIKPNHNLFLLFLPKQNFSRGELINICKNIANSLKIKYDMKYCGSFGFDFIAIDTYINISDNKETIRLSLNDYDSDLIQKFSTDFMEILNDYI